MALGLEQVVSSGFLNFLCHKSLLYPWATVHFRRFCLSVLRWSVPGAVHKSGSLTTAGVDPAAPSVGRCLWTHMSARCFLWVLLILLGFVGVLVVISTHHDVRAKLSPLREMTFSERLS